MVTNKSLSVAAISKELSASIQQKIDGKTLISQNFVRFKKILCLILQAILST